MKHFTDITVRYAETDKMGIVHHSNYAIWFEAARTDFIRSLGISYTECEKRGVMLPLFSLEINFIKPALYEDIVTINTYIENLSGVRLILGYTAYNKKTGEQLASGKTHHAWTDKDLKPVNIKKFDKEIYEMLLSAWDS